MKDKEYILKYKECKYDELSAEDLELVKAARSMTANSYAPYSHFQVGAAIRMADGTIATGANQENAAFPSGTCAERTACYHAAASKPGMAMKKIAVAAFTDGDFQEQPISPCGACRQALMEYEKLHGPIEVILCGRDSVYLLPSVASLLPFTFTEF
ncbi:MAG: cytidine deaminase [Muribaculaceae bacterium]|nr:cytidine deaminase [Muribaculaceae bacterium]